MIGTISVYTPLGLRFWDPARGEAVRDALEVAAWPAGTTASPRGAFRTGAGIYAFDRLPGLRLDTVPAASPPPATRGFVVAVADARRRYLPAAWQLDLPLDEPGVFLTGPQDGGPENSDLPGLPLYSAPTRPRSTGLATVRGELRDRDAAAPAAHALVRLTIPGQAEDTWWGLADAKGRFAIFFPHPVFLEALGSPPKKRRPPASSGLTPLDERRWAITLEVFYRPDEQTSLTGTSLPDYLSLLRQPSARVWRQAPDAAPRDDWSGELAPGQDNVVRTLGLSWLLVEPGES